VITLVGLFLVSVAGFAVAVINASPAAESPAPASVSTLPAPDDVDAASGESGVPFRLAAAVPDQGTPPPPPSAGALVADGVSPTASAAPTVAFSVAEFPILPVAGFWSKADAISKRDARTALESGKARGYKRIVVEERIRDALAEALGIEVHADIRSRDVTGVEAAVANGALGFLAATDVTPRVRALEMNDASLFGNDRVRRTSSWPLMAPVVSATATDLAAGSAAEPGADPAAAAMVNLDETLPDQSGSTAQEDDTWSQDRTWVLVAAGDAFTDRGIYDNVVRKGKGIDFPFDGGTARVTGHGCCDPVFGDNVVPRYVLTGNKGVVRRLFKGAELAITNHESPVTSAWAFHSSGTRFSGKPELTKIFTRAGIDWVSLANNHIKDYGSEGIKDTRRILKRNGLRFGGAGKDLAQARRISYLDVGETRIAIIPCVGVGRASWAGPRTSGGTPCLDRYLVPDIKEASRKADFVIVFPHWGVEYTRKPLPSMRKHAARWVKAGANLIVGAHSHVAGAIEDIEGTPVLYSMGNLIFDQHWSTNTMESFFVEATFHGDRLVQMRLHPYIVHSQTQPNLLDPARGEGRRLLREVKAASSAWLDW
jgi:poly-gamma-glutamate capsule biosynthesis protein CapA/YwtB (metallophosphatase superfamily)